MGNNFWVDNRVWVVGASSGIGRALSECLAERGAMVTASARNLVALERLTIEQRLLGREIRHTHVDVTDLASVQRAYTEICAATGGVDTLIYSAGAWDPIDVLAFSVENIEAQCQVNYLGLARCVAQVLPGMANQRRSTIVGITSASAYVALPRAEAYGASKAASNYFLRCLRLDVKKLGIDVAVVAPGFVDTPLTHKNDFRMPFLLSANSAALAIIDGLEKGRSEISPPRRLTVPLRLLASLPLLIQERLVSAIFRR